MLLRVKHWEGTPTLHKAFSGHLQPSLASHLEKAIPHFAQQEIFSLLGEEFFSSNPSFVRSPLTLARAINHLAVSSNTPLPPLTAPHQGNPIYFAPVFSGFFSIIENLLLMDFFSRLAGGHLVLSPEQFWWGYEVRFSEIFPSLFQIADPSQTERISWFTRDGAADWLQSQTPELQFEFFKFKCAQYNLISDHCAKFLERLGVSQLDYNSSSVLFLRGGDKFSQETVPFPDSLVTFELGRLSSLGDGVQVLSDEFNMAQELQNRFPGVQNISRQSMQGHTLLGNRNRQDVIEILQNFLFLSNSRVAAGCPSSNLMNAANQARIGRGCPAYTSKTFPVPAYLLP